MKEEEKRLESMMKEKMKEWLEKERVQQAEQLALKVDGYRSENQKEMKCLKEKLEE